MIRLGNEFQVNTYTSSNQTYPAVAADADGDFVIAWQSELFDAGDVFVTRFSSAGAPLSEFRVNTYTTSFQLDPSVAADSDGDFVVAWESYQDGESVGVFARRFSSAGAALAEFQVNTYSTGNQSRPSIGMAGDGDFVIAWNSFFQDGAGYGVFARRFSSAGGALASEFIVNNAIDHYLNNQFNPSVAVDTDGDFVIAWQSELFDAGDVFVTRFSSAGAPLSEFRVNTYTTSYQLDPSVAADSDGDFVVAWESYQDGDDAGVFARRFSSAGAALASEFQVNTYTPGRQSRPRVASGADGSFVVAWHEPSQDGSSFGVVARRFSSSGAALASEFQVNTYTAGKQSYPSVAGAGSRFVVAWTSGGQDGSVAGVFAQRFAALTALDFDGNGSTGALTDGLLFLRYAFGFRGATLTTGAVAGDCFRCDAISIEDYVAGLMRSAPLAHEVRLGAEFQVNTFTPGVQTYPAVAASASGDFAVAWQSGLQDGFYNGVFARRFSGTGAALATEFEVNTYTSYEQSRASLAASASGDFVVAWHSFAQDGSKYGSFERRFSSAGAPLASELQVNTFTANDQKRPSVAADAGGRHIVVWESGHDGSSYGIFARRFSSTGIAVATEFQVNTFTPNYQGDPAVAAEADGDFVVVWHSGLEDGSSYGIFARRFSSAGTAVASEFQVNSHTASGQFTPSVATDANGDFVVAWHGGGQDGPSYGIFAQRFSSAGVALASELQVNLYVTDDQRRALVATDTDGDFVIVWRSKGQDGSGYGAFARRFSSAGEALAGEFQVSDYTTGDQSDPSVTMDGRGQFVIAWHSDQDGGSHGVFAQRFLGAAIAADIDGNGAVQALTDGLLVLRYLFGFRGATLTTGAVGAGCSRCDAAAIEPYVAGLV